MPKNDRAEFHIEFKKCYNLCSNVGACPATPPADLPCSTCLSNEINSRFGVNIIPTDSRNSYIHGITVSATEEEATIVLLSL